MLIANSKSSITVDPQQYKQKAKQQHDRIIEILDKIDVCSVNTLHSLQKLAKFYDFLIENPLRHFIPPSKTYNNQSYADYEAELVMYIRIATTGNSIKWLTDCVAICTSGWKGNCQANYATRTGFVDNSWALDFKLGKTILEKER